MIIYAHFLRFYLCRCTVCSLLRIKKELLSTKSSFFVIQAACLGISSPHEVRCISSAPSGLYLITRQRASYLRLDDIHALGVIIKIALLCKYDVAHFTRNDAMFAIKCGEKEVKRCVNNQYLPQSRSISLK